MGSLALEFVSVQSFDQINIIKFLKTWLFGKKKDRSRDSIFESF